MKAVYMEKGSLAIVETNKPKPSPGEALIKVLYAGICNTDLELYRGYYNFSGIPGHEFVGRVVEVNNGDSSWVGKRVCANINIGCGKCRWCLIGDTRHCENRKTLGIFHQPGVFAEYAVLPIKNLITVPEDVSNEEAVYVEPLAAALEIAQQVHIKAEDKIAILGDGKLGLLCAFALSVYSSNLLLIGRHENKLKVASEIGIRTFLSCSELLHETFDLVVEATGTDTGIAEAIELTRPRGVLAVKTTSHKPSVIDMAKVVVNELQIIGSRCGIMSSAMGMLTRNHIPVTRLTEAVYPFEDFPTAFEHAMRKGALKIVVKFQDT